MEEHSAGSRHPGRPAAWFLMGILIVLYLPSPPSLWWTLAVVPVVLPLVPPKGRGAVLLVAAGAAWVTYRAELVIDQWLPAPLEKRDLVVEGRVRSLPQKRERYLKFDFDVERLRIDGQWHTSDHRLRLRVYDPAPAVAAGEHWRLAVRLTRPYGVLNPGGLDYEKHLFRARITAVGYVRGGDHNRRLAPPSGIWLPVRRAIADTIDAALGDRPGSPVIRALAIGDRSAFTANHWQVLRRTGTGHLVAISGLHVGLIAGIAFWLGQYGWRWAGTAPLYHAAPNAGAAAGVAAALVYAGLAGFSIPTQRAVVMLCVVAIAASGGRHASVLGLLSIALLAVLIYDPLAPIDPGFWLSFGAVMVLTLGLRSVSPGRRRTHMWIGAQFSIAIGLLPLLALLFAGTSLVGPVANLIAIPVVGLFVVPLTLASLTIHALGAPGLASAGLASASQVIEWLWWFLLMLSEWRFAAWQIPPVHLLSWLVGSAGALWWVAARGVPARWLGLVGLVPLVITGGTRNALQVGEFQTTVLDVGQGLSVVVHTRRSVLVYDTGASWGDANDVGAAILIPYLEHHGIDHVDTLVISHGDNDHIGGARSLLERYYVASIISSVPERLPGARACLAGQAWRRDGVEFRVLGPPPGARLSSNDGSCVVRIAGRFGSLLLTGDIEAQAEELLVQRYGRRLRADLLLVPHQGSNTSSTAAFLEHVAPDRALVSAGYRNRYDHPHRRVLQRYESLAIPVHNTAHSGALRLTFARSGITLTRERDQRRRLWHTRPRAGRDNS